MVQEWLNGSIRSLNEFDGWMTSFTMYYMLGFGCGYLMTRLGHNNAVLLYHCGSQSILGVFVTRGILIRIYVILDYVSLCQSIHRSTLFSPRCDIRLLKYDTKAQRRQGDDSNIRQMGFLESYGCPIFCLHGAWTSWVQDKIFGDMDIFFQFENDMRSSVADFNSALAKRWRSWIDGRFNFAQFEGRNEDVGEYHVVACQGRSFYGNHIIVKSKSCYFIVSSRP